MSIRVDAHEVGDLARDLDRAAATNPAKVQATGKTYGRRIASTMKADAPKRTGAMADSVSADVRSAGTGVALEVGPTVDYAPFVEDGTRYMEPQPFVAPAFDRHLDGFIRAIAQDGAEIL